MQALRSILMILVIGLIGGCASGPTPEQIASANYGKVPDQAQLEQSAKTFFGMYLKDGNSAQYQFAPAYQGWVHTDRLEGSKFYAGYLLDVLVNAKNSYGGYTGWRKYQFIFNNGKILRAASISPQGISRKIP